MQERYPRRAFNRFHKTVWEQANPLADWVAIQTGVQDNSCQVGSKTSIKEANRCFADVTKYGWTETFNHLLPEKEEPNVVNQCPMDVCLCPTSKRLTLLEDFYEEVCRIVSEVDGSTKVQATLSNALRKVDHAKKANA